MPKRSSLLLVNKRPGITSFASLYPVKHTIDSKVGHAGTLDKFAEGLMIVLTGAFTRLNPLFSSMDKTYEADIRFGIETSTLDPEGETVYEAPVPGLSAIQKNLETEFTGIILQTPPSYSAIHVDGVRAYKLAREGKNVMMTGRPITIHDTTILSWDPPILKLRVHCSKGTYIRSLARDLGRACGSCASLTALKRTSIGPYTLDEAVDPQDNQAMVAMSLNSIGLLHRLDGLADIVVSNEALKGLTHGNLPPVESLGISTVSPNDGFALLQNQEGQLLAVVTLGLDHLPQRIVALPCAEGI